VAPKIFWDKKNWRPKILGKKELKLLVQNKFGLKRLRVKQILGENILCSKTFAQP